MLNLITLCTDFLEFYPMDIIWILVIPGPLFDIWFKKKHFKCNIKQSSKSLHISGMCLGVGRSKYINAEILSHLKSTFY